MKSGWFVSPKKLFIREEPNEPRPLVGWKCGHCGQKYLENELPFDEKCQCGETIKGVDRGPVQ